MSNTKVALATEIQKLLANGGTVGQIAAMLAAEDASPAKPRETGLYTGRPAYDAGWGLKLDDAFAKAELNWNAAIAKTQATILLPNGEEVILGGQNILYRDDNGHKLGDCGDQYSLFQNEKGKELIAEVCGKDCIVDTIGSLGGGKKVWISVKAPEDLKVLGEEFKQLFLMAWGHDGSTPLNGGFNAIRVYCQNTLTMAIQGLGESPWKSIPHKSGMEAMIQRSITQWQNRIEVSKAMQVEAERLVSVKFSEKKWEGLVDNLFPLAQDTSKRATTAVQEQRSAFWKALNAEDLQNFARTGWGFVQAAADYADHTKPIREVKGWEERRAWESISGSPVVARAKELVLS